MDNNLSWAYHITEITSKIAKSTYQLARIKHFIDERCRKTFYHAYIHNKLEYGILHTWKRQMEFLGHVCRRRGLEFLSLTGKVEGKRDRGKQRITFLDSLCNSATGGQSKGLNFLKLSDDRDVWRGMVANVCSRSGT